MQNQKMRIERAKMPLYAHKCNQMSPGKNHTHSGQNQHATLWSCAAPVEVVALVLGDLAGGRWDQRRAADVLLDPRIPAVDVVVARRVGPRRRARPRARRPPCTCRGVLLSDFTFTQRFSAFHCELRKAVTKPKE